ncbi:hypothetical protein [Actinomadura sp. 6N118]|uniref:hypothetical protein n=1 Tax=Actinomadura sp. 6N118 TaxID=3375151 RepID=UPI00379152A1
MGKVSDASASSRGSVPVDPGRLAWELERRYPDVCAWLGRVTGSWWAFAPNHERLIEAKTAAALGRRLDELGARRLVTIAGDNSAQTNGTQTETAARLVVTPGPEEAPGVGRRVRWGRRAHGTHAANREVR